jgi:hypothetical protein
MHSTVPSFSTPRQLKYRRTEHRDFGRVLILCTRPSNGSEHHPGADSSLDGGVVEFASLAFWVLLNPRCCVEIWVARLGRSKLNRLRVKETLGGHMLNKIFWETAVPMVKEPSQSGVKVHRYSEALLLRTQCSRLSRISPDQRLYFWLHINKYIYLSEIQFSAA